MRGEEKSLAEQVLDGKREHAGVRHLVGSEGGRKFGVHGSGLLERDGHFEIALVLVDSFHIATGALRLHESVPGTVDRNKGAFGISANRDNAESDNDHFRVVCLDG